MSYKDLIVWKKSILLVKEVYKLTDKFPESERFGLTSQIKRAVISIPSNIAEVHGRKSLKERSQFFSIAFGSALEVETQIYIAKDIFNLKETNIGEAEALLEEVLKILNVLSKKSSY